LFLGGKERYFTSDHPPEATHVGFHGHYDRNGNLNWPLGYTDAYSAYGPIVAGKSGIWWFTLRNRWDPGARYMPAEREVLAAARDGRRHWELTTEAMPAALLGELREAT